MELPNTEVDVFEMFNRWLYTGTLRENGKLWDSASFDTLVELYVFADMVRIPALKNCALRGLDAAATDVDEIPVDKLKYIWENTTPDSNLRRFAIDQCVWELDEEGFNDEHLEKFPNVEVCLCIMRAMHRRYTKKTTINPLLTLSNYDEPEDKAEEERILPRTLGIFKAKSDRE
jgi:hypothetical protein